MAENTALPDATLSERIRKFTDFLDNNHGPTNYKEEIRQILQRGQTRLRVSLDELRDFDRSLWNG
jgi:DNA replication licensing factor MCM3